MQQLSWQDGKQKAALTTAGPAGHVLAWARLGIPWSRGLAHNLGRGRAGLGGEKHRAAGRSTWGLGWLARAGAEGGGSCRKAESGDRQEE